MLSLKSRNRAQSLALASIRLQMDFNPLFQLFQLLIQERAVIHALLNQPSMVIVQVMPL